MLRLISTEHQLVTESVYTMFPLNEPEITVTVQRWRRYRKLWLFNYLIKTWMKPLVRITYNPAVTLSKGVTSETVLPATPLTDYDIFLTIQQAIKKSNPQWKFITN